MPDFFDSILVYSPPLNLCTTARKISKLQKCDYSIILRDMFPQNAIDLGILKNPAIIAYFRNIEKKAYQAAKKIFPQCGSNRESLISKFGLSEEKVITVHNWTTFSKDVERRKDFKKLFSLEDNFVCLYAGTIGPSQDLEFLLKAAQMV